MGFRPLDGFYERLRLSIPVPRLIMDPLRTLAFGTDASFYRLIPKLVVKAKTSDEIRTILEAAHLYDIPVTFRAAGTSLSGQAVTDAVLVVAGTDWKNYKILDNGEKIRLQPGVIGAHANAYLAPFGRKIGPDPASINAAMIGGIAANNASGMCCGTAQNSYQTVDGIRVILHDGTELNTSRPESRRQFKKTHGDMLEQIEVLSKQIRNNTELASRIRRKFKIKNTTGYSLNALIDYQDPIDIIEHLMIGSEGTLGFIAEIVYRTVVDHPHKATSLMIFPEMESACTAATILRAGPAYAVELMDRAALRSVESKTGMPSYLKTLSPHATALLVETRGSEPGELHDNIAGIVASLDRLETVRPIEFTDQSEDYNRLWNIRKGLFPAVGAVRRIGTTVVIEDVVFPIESLSPATLELQDLMKNHRYSEAIIFGHALEGNLHFVFTQDFGTAAEIDRYRRFMDDVCEMVVNRYDGSLKGEHGTGRNMAPFVEMEWGRDAFRIMKKIKKIFDPKNLLNPGVILNDSPHAHIENLKPLPQTDALVDKCIECGFCEAACPSKNVTLTPRQRIVSRREISRLRASGNDPERLGRMETAYVYLGEQTCATDGLCGLSCPVDINTADLTKSLRGENVEGATAQYVADWIAYHFKTVSGLVRMSLGIADMIHDILGTRGMETAAAHLRKLSRNKVPLWNRCMPGYAARHWKGNVPVSGGSKVVYFPSCVSRTMGPAGNDPIRKSLPDVTSGLLKKAGFDILFPKHMASLCCGMAFESKGFKQQADKMSARLAAVLLDVSQNGRYPVLCDTSPCLFRMKQVMPPQLSLYDPVEFILYFLTNEIDFEPTGDTIAVHVPCSAKKMGLDDAFRRVSETLAKETVFPEHVDCCGFAGDRGFTFPELNASALSELKAAVSGTCTAGYSTSRTCEIGLSLHSGLHYRSIFYLASSCAKS